jgi:hypothetical protein
VSAYDLKKYSAFLFFPPHPLFEAALSCGHERQMEMRGEEKRALRGRGARIRKIKEDGLGHQELSFFSASSFNLSFSHSPLVATQEEKEKEKEKKK